MRGWSVRSLGPGSYQRKDPTSDFMNQCGDVRLDFNIEYRSKLIWKLELAAFIDAGNIWTIKDYAAQPGGAFKINGPYVTFDGIDYLYDESAMKLYRHHIGELGNILVQIKAIRATTEE